MGPGTAGSPRSRGWPPGPVGSRDGGKGCVWGPSTGGRWPAVPAMGLLDGRPLPLVTLA